MRGRDEETGEYRDISRSENRRQALEVLALGEQLVGLTPAATQGELISVENSAGQEADR